MFRSFTKWPRLQRCGQRASKLSTATSTTNLPTSEAKSPKTVDEIGIPYAVKVDLLRALAGTIDVDPTAPHFAFIDDPLTIPTDSQRDLYYVSKEMGRRAAQQLAEEWPTLFMYDTDIPRIQAYRPQKPPDPAELALTVENLQKLIAMKKVAEATELALTVENLQKLIAMKKVAEASQLYDKMATENIAIPKEILVDLFRLLVYYNGKPIPAAEMPWHGWRNYGSQAEQQESQVWDSVRPSVFSTMLKYYDFNSVLI
ncbi:unnamed protein product [Gongylonema pulchrum]|uniref:Protein PTCD3 homolog, mitochondrial n=1 Tax=Gongylonema pulchrum TaxID=637853 RepID=A0A183ESX0_9BILA|nr:unnamed protein product [Gongylonema pulchrum]